MLFRDSDEAPEPLTRAEIDAIRKVFRFYDRASLVPRLVATVEAFDNSPTPHRG